jgi:putative flippase GtrA
MRWANFTAVGALGIGVQLALLAALIRLGVNYLAATGLAVEMAVLHNFWWHQRFTWADRRHDERAQVFQRLLRFHLSNGAISMIGNLLLMRLLVGSLRLPVMAANLATIASCSLANFLASDRWVFLPLWTAEAAKASE